jgi:hypothetical protein
MKAIKQILLTTLTTFIVSVSDGQTDIFKSYKYERNDNYNKLNFSFDIPTDWEINPETIDGTSYFLLCAPVADSITQEYTDCFNGLIFRVKSRKSDLDSTLLQMGLQKKSEGMYLTTFHGKIKIVIITKIRGATYHGLYYTISNDINCKSEKKSKVVGQYQFLYFSKESQTIVLETNGAKLNDTVFKRMIDTFTFY